MSLHNVAERLLSPKRHKRKITGICCTYSIHSPVPAVRSCLHCEASLCENHLRVHSKGAEHVILEPSTNLENRKCSVHRKILEYYCTEDNACISVSCRLAREHQGHWVEMLDEASEKKKEKLRNVLQKLTTKREKTEERVQSLEEQRRKAQEKASGEAKRVPALFIDIRRRLDELEKGVLSEISRQEKEVSLSSSALIQQLKIKKDKLCRRMSHIEELCNMRDPLTVLQDPDTGDLCDSEKEGGNEDIKGHDGGDEDTEGHDGGDLDTGGHDKIHDIDMDVITGMLLAGLSNIMTDLQTISPAKPRKKRKLHHTEQSPFSHTQNSPVSGTECGGSDVVVRTGGVRGKVTVTGNRGTFGKGPAGIVLDINTAANNILISDDLKIATCGKIRHSRPKTGKRFQDHQVMSRRRFSSGQHYWDVEISGSGCGGWRVGMCYPSIDRRGSQSYIGENNKSWCLWGGKGCNNEYSVRHSSQNISLHQTSTDRVRICLDYEAGELSFYELCDSIRHLHTFTATFTEPLHAVLCVYDGSVKILRGTGDRRN